jgi:hypothetical protein
MKRRQRVMEVRMSMYFSVGFLLWSYGGVGDCWIDLSVHSWAKSPPINSCALSCIIVLGAYTVPLNECLEGRTGLSYAFSGIEKNKAGVVVQVKDEDIVHLCLILFIHYSPIQGNEFMKPQDSSCQYTLS